jgi:(E)-4-hydroxy-3-methylbut-2-enyl-diphosphate synthase
MSKIIRRKTRTVKIGRLRIGSGHAILVQSMVKVSTKKVPETTRQIRRLTEAGCDIVRLAIEDREDALAIKEIKRQVSVPLVADIHFDYRLALTAIESGIDKVRLNPGNIYKPQEVRAVIAAAKLAHIPIRIGANSGSLRIKAKDPAEALVKSVLDYLRIFKKDRFGDLVISLKGSGTLDTIEAYEKMARLCDYPLHLGVTATGLPLDGVVKSSVGIGVLLFKGIGDTIRMSLLQQPEEEVLAAQSLLNSLGLRHFGPDFICCPTCGRCEVALLEKAQKLQRLVCRIDKSKRLRLNNYKIAVMGCVVNGPGEAREADVGIAFSKHKGILFKKGKIVRTVDLGKGEEALFDLIKKEIA